MPEKMRLSLEHQQQWTCMFYPMLWNISIKPGDEIIVTNQDHEANIGAWRRLKNTWSYYKGMAN